MSCDCIAVNAQHKKKNNCSDFDFSFQYFNLQSCMHIKNINSAVRAFSVS